MPALREVNYFTGKEEDHVFVRSNAQELRSRSIVRDAADHADFIVRRLDGGGRLLVLFDSLFDLVCAYLYNPYIVQLDKNTMKNAGRLLEGGDLGLRADRLDDRARGGRVAAPCARDHDDLLNLTPLNNAPRRGHRAPRQEHDEERWAPARGR